MNEKKWNYQYLFRQSYGHGCTRLYKLMCKAVINGISDHWTAVTDITVLFSLVAQIPRRRSRSQLRKSFSARNLTGQLHRLGRPEF